MHRGCSCAVGTALPDNPRVGSLEILFSAALQSDLSRLSEIDKSLAVFCMATYGEGDPTDNAQDFYDWLQEADTDLSGLRFAVSQFVPVSAAFGQEKPKTLHCELLRSRFCCIWAAKPKTFRCACTWLGYRHNMMSVPLLDAVPIVSVCTDICRHVSGGFKRSCRSALSTP